MPDVEFAEEVMPRVYRFDAGREFGHRNASPVKVMVPTLDGAEVPLEAGQQSVEWRPGWRDFRTPEGLQRIVPDGLPQVAWWGPLPDPVLPHSAASARVSSGYNPAGCLKVHTNESVLLGQALVAAQGLRGSGFADWFNPLMGEHFLGGGYGSAAGGFHVKFDKPLPEFAGVTYGPSGLPVPDTQHGVLDHLVWFALTFNSVAAVFAAAGQWAAMVSAMVAGEYQPSRGYGWFLKASAYMHELARVHPACPYTTAQVEQAIAVALKRVRGQWYLGAPAADSGTGASEGGHLEGRKSDSTFFVGILATGCLDVLEIIGARASDPNIIAQARAVLEDCLAFLSSCLRASPGPGFVDDRAPLEGDVAFGPTSIHGVQARFVLPPVLRLARGNYPELMTWAQPIIDWCDQHGAWGGSSDRDKWAAEVGLVTGS